MKMRIALIVVVMLAIAVGGQFNSVKAGSLNEGLQQWQSYLQQWEEKLEDKAEGLQQWEDYLVKQEKSLKNRESNNLKPSEKKLKEKEEGLQQWENHLKKWEKRLDKRENFDERFIVSNISYKNYQYVDATKVFGEIKNNFSNDLKIANFTLTFYDQTGNILDVVSIGISDWKVGYKKTFEAITDGRVKDKVARYKVQYDGGY